MVMSTWHSTIIPIEEVVCKIQIGYWIRLWFFKIKLLTKNLVWNLSLSSLFFFKCLFQVYQGDGKRPYYQD